MADREEIARILKLVEQGKVTSAQATELIAALDGTGTERTGTPSTEPAKSVRIVVRKGVDGPTKVNLTLPYGLVDFALGVCQRFVPAEDTGNIDWEDLKQQLRHGLRGKIIDVYDDDEDTSVVIEVL